MNCLEWSFARLSLFAHRRSPSAHFAPRPALLPLPSFGNRDLYLVVLCSAAITALLLPSPHASLPFIVCHNRDCLTGHFNHPQTYRPLSTTQPPLGGNTETLLTPSPPFGLSTVALRNRKAEVVLLPVSCPTYSVSAHITHINKYIRWYTGPPTVQRCAADLVPSRDTLVSS